eukprot:248061-Prorocentrum_minimum.AAC.3
MQSVSDSTGLTTCEEKDSKVMGPSYEFSSRALPASTPPLSVKDRAHYLRGEGLKGYGPLVRVLLQGPASVNPPPQRQPPLPSGGGVEMRKLVDWLGSRTRSTTRAPTGWARATEVLRELRLAGMAHLKHYGSSDWLGWHT